MIELLAKLRALAGIDDERIAREREVATERELTTGPSVHPAAVRHMRELAARPGTIRLGSATLDAEVPMVVEVPRDKYAGHVLCTGATGSGKTTVLASACRQLMRAYARSPTAPTIAIVDHKGDLANAAQDIAAELATSMPRAQAQAFLGQFAVIDPFASDALVPFQVLAGEPDTEPAVLAYEVTSLLGRLAGDPFGSRQEAFTFLTLLDGRLTGRSLVAIDALFADPSRLLAVMRRSPSTDVRQGFASGLPLGVDGIAGVRARLQRLLRLRSSRLSLGASSTASLRECLAARVLVIDLGSHVPLGCEDIGRFWSGFFTLKLVRAIFSRSRAEARRPAFVFIDEWQEGLESAGGIAADYARVLQMARSKSVSLVLSSQSLASASAVSAALPRHVATNTAVQLRFRASEEDALAMRRLLPVTGRRLRTHDERRHDRRGPDFLSPEEERSLLAAEAATLPDRTFYYWDQRQRGSALLANADRVDITARANAPAWIQRAVKRGCLAQSVEELEEQLATTVRQGHFAAAPQPPTEPPAPRRRTRRR